jgi:hypothetical protein
LQSAHFGGCQRTDESEQIVSERLKGDAISRRKRHVGGGRKRTESGGKSGKRIALPRRRARSYLAAA